MRRYIRRARTNLCYQTTFTSTSQTELGRWPLSGSRLPSSAAITLQLTVTGQPTEHWNIHQSKYLHLRRLKGPCSQPRQLTDETEIRKVKNRKLDGDNLKGTFPWITRFQFLEKLYQLRVAIEGPLEMSVLRRPWWDITLMSVWRQRAVLTQYSPLIPIIQSWRDGRDPSYHYRSHGGSKLRAQDQEMDLCCQYFLMAGRQITAGASGRGQVSPEANLRCAVPLNCVTWTSALWESRIFPTVQCGLWMWWCVAIIGNIRYCRQNRQQEAAKLNILKGPNYHWNWGFLQTFTLLLTVHSPPPCSQGGEGGGWEEESF